MDEDFPMRLKRLRKERNKSKLVLSELCGLHPRAVSRYECGEICPSIQSLIALADYFEVSVDYLIGRTNEKNFENGPRKYQQEKENVL